jgi:hypothetical protein
VQEGHSPEIVRHVGVLLVAHSVGGGPESLCQASLVLPTEVGKAAI